MINFYLNSNQSKEALEYLTLAKQNDPTNASFHFAEGTLFDKIGDFEKSVSAYRGAIELNPEYFDAIVIVGGPGSPKLARTTEVVDLVEAAFKKEKLVAAICLGPMALAAAGILSNKEATVYPSPSGIEALKNGGANYKPEPVIVDGNIVTADSPQSAEKFGITIVGLLKE